MKKLLQTVAVIIFLNLVATAHAQTLSLEECLRLALQKNQRLASAGYAVRGAERRVKEIGTLKKPSVHLLGGASFAPSTGFDPAITNAGEYAGLLEIKQTLYDGGAIRFSKHQAEAKLQQAANDKVRTAADIRLEVRLAYLDLLNAQRQHKLLQESSKDLESYLETVRALANGGAVPKTDIMKVEIQLQSEKIALNDLNVAATTAMQRLLEPLGLPLDTTIAIQDTLALPAWPQKFVTNLDLKSAEFEVESAQLDLKLAQTERAPVISAFAGAGGWTSRLQLIESSSPHIFGYQAGVALEMPILSWGAITARVEQKNAALNALRADFEVLRRRFNAEYQTHWQQYRAATEKLRLLEASRQKALEQYEILQAQYAGGGASGLEVIDSHRTLLEIALQEEQTRAEIDILHAQMLRLTGETE